MVATSPSHAHLPDIHAIPPSAPPSSPDGSAALASEVPPPIPFSTHPQHSRVLHISVDSPPGPSYGEDSVRLSGSPPPIPVSSRPPQAQLDRYSTVTSTKALNQNHSNGNLPPQYPHPVSPSASARWTPSSPASPSRSRHRARYHYYAVTVGKRTGVFSDW
jgi:hypothetical protein